MDHESLLNEALASADSAYVVHALQVVAMARGVQVTLTRDSLPDWLRAMQALGITLTARLTP